jgi:hypothetical protein
MKNDKKSLLTTAAFLGLISVSSLAFAEGSCNEYPNKDTEKWELDENGNIKNMTIVKTGEADVLTDDASSVKTAKTEATLKAKAAIAHFIKEELTSETAFNQISIDASKNDGNQKTVNSESVKETVTKIKNSANQILQGVTVLGDCYTKSKEVRVTVGVKSETRKIAENYAKDVKSSSSTNEKSTPVSGTSSSAPQSQNSSNGMQGMDSFSNSTRLENF